MRWDWTAGAPRRRRRTVWPDRAAMKEKLTHSLKPRAASVRRTARARRCADVSTGLATACGRGPAPPTAHRPGRGCGRFLPPDRRGRRCRGGKLGGVTCKMSPCSSTVKPSRDRMRMISPLSIWMPPRLSTRPGSKSICLCGRRQFARDHHFGRLAAAPFQDQPGAKLQPRQHEFRIDAALEAIARVGNDAQLAPGARHAHRIEPGGFDEDIAWSPANSRSPRRP